MRSRRPRGTISTPSAARSSSSDLQVGRSSCLCSPAKVSSGRKAAQDLGELLGLITGDGHFTNRGRGKEAVVVSLWGDDRALAERIAAYMNVLMAQAILNAARTYCVHPVAVPDRNMVFLRSVAVVRALAHYGFTAATKHQVPEVVWRGSEDCVRGYLARAVPDRRHRQCLERRPELLRPARVESSQPAQGRPACCWPISGSSAESGSDETRHSA